MTDATDASDMYDLLIVGGGINGVGVARDAAGRGLRVMLCEKDDLAAHTSSASTKLIHGGLRYLEHYDFGLVRKALKEREVLLRAAPHIIWPMRFVLPVHRDMRPAWLVRLGLFIYDHLGGRKLLPATKTLRRGRDKVFAPLQPHLTKAFEYSDCWVDDSRLVVLNAVDAGAHGADIRTRTRCVALEREIDAWTATLMHNGKPQQVRARALINAAGPWVDDLARLSGTASNRNAVRLVKGSHIVVDRLFDHDRSYFFQHDDGRLVFVIPYLNGTRTLIGTTDVAFEGDPGTAHATKDEIEYLCEVASEYFQQPVRPEDVRSTYSGVRPLYDDHAKSASTVTRDYVLTSSVSSAAPVVSIYGGKITTYRKLSEDVLKLLAPAFPGAGKPWTKHAPLPGGDIADANFDVFLETQRSRYPWIPEPMLYRLARAYGTRLELVIGKAGSLSDLGRHFGADLYEAEVDYLTAQEFALTAEDIAFRRTKTGLDMTASELTALNVALMNRDSF